MDKLLEAYTKKEIPLNYGGVDLRFKVSQSLFSSYDIDIGTKRLLRTFIFQDFQNYNKVLDLGCGYGPLGIALKSVNKSAEVHMVDRDALALAFSRINSKLNNTRSIKIYSSLGYDDVKDKNFDLIVSNLPAKVGEEVLSNLLIGGKYHLNPTGRMSIVIVDAIYDYVKKILSDTDINILYHKSWPGHHVFHYEFSKNGGHDNQPKNAWEEEKYIRGKVNISYPNSLNFSIHTTYNLPEFDNPSHDTELLLKNLNLAEHGDSEKVLFFNPGQGYLPVALSKLRKISVIKLVDRNLQSLKTSRVNLIQNNFNHGDISLSHRIGMGQSDKKAYDIIIGKIDEKENSEVLKILVEQTASLIKSNGIVLLASSSNTITRIMSFFRKIKGLRILKRGRSKGKSFIAIKLSS